MDPFYAASLALLVSVGLFALAEKAIRFTKWRRVGGLTFFSHSSGLGGSIYRSRRR